MSKRVMPLRLQKYAIRKVACAENKTNTEKEKDTFVIDHASLSKYLLSIHIDIVYFANLFVNIDYGAQLIGEQLKDLISTGLMEVARAHIVLSVPHDFDYISMQTELRSLFHDHHNVVFNINHDNCHEYPGIQLVHSIASENNSDSHHILYFHSKSMTRFRGKREKVEILLHNTVIARWQEVMEIFRTRPEINKIGSTSSPEGWIWWNYWWVRSSYIVKVESPIKTERRHYYEIWLARVLIKNQNETNPDRPENPCDSQNYNLTDKNCYSLSLKKDNIGNGCDAQGAIHHIFR